MIDQAKDLISEFVGNFRQIDDVLFAGAQPQLPEGIDELAQKYGIKAVIDLQGHDVQREGEAVLAAGMEFWPMALPGVEIVTEPPRDKVEQIMELVDSKAAKPVFVHCLHGADRTGAIVGIYRVERGATAKEAIAEMKHYHNSWIEFGFRDAVEDFYEKIEKVQTQGGN